MAQFTIPARTRRARCATRWVSPWPTSPASTTASSPSMPTCGPPPACTSSSTSIPDKLVKFGIAEQNLIAMAAGLSQEGYIPFPCTFDAFCRRFMDQLYVSVAYGNLNVKVLGAYAGLFTGKAGATHQSDKELGLLLRVPNLRVIEPGCNDEMAQALRVAVETPGPFYLRIVRCEVAQNEIAEGYRFRLGKGVTVLDEGSDVGLVSTGYMISTAQAAARKLRARASARAWTITPRSSPSTGNCSSTWREGARHRDRWRTTARAAGFSRWSPRPWPPTAVGVPVGASAPIPTTSSTPVTSTTCSTATT